MRPVPQPLAAALLLIAPAAVAPTIDFGPTEGVDYLGGDYSLLQPPALPPAATPAAGAAACAAKCNTDSRCIAWMYCPAGGECSHPGPICLLKDALYAPAAVATHWGGASRSRAPAWCAAHNSSCLRSPSWAVPPDHHSPRIHYGAPCFATPSPSAWQVWHDVAAAISLPDGSHHLWMGCPSVNGWEEGGWHHAVSNDLVRWRSMGIDVRAINESHGSADAPDTPVSMKSQFTPCAGFVTIDDATGDLCVGLRQCYSRVGLPGGHSWDVPLELRCANITGSSNNTMQFQPPEFLFDVYFAKNLAFDPVRPWRGQDGRYYAVIAGDACNDTRSTLGKCDLGSSALLWSSPALRGARASWRHEGSLLSTNRSVFQREDHGGKPATRRTVEFITPTYFGGLIGDTPEADTRVWMDSSGNGDGIYVQYFIGRQPAEGRPLEVDWADQAAVGVFDWNTFVATPGGAVGAAGIEHEPSQPYTFGLVRTLGGDTNQVAPTRGSQRRIAIGEVLRGPTNPVLQSLPRDLSLSPKRELLQAFVPELESLRIHSTAVVWNSRANESSRSTSSPVLLRGSQMEVVFRARLPSVVPLAENISSGVAEIRFMQLGGGAYTSVVLDLGRMHVSVDGSQQGGRRNSGPLYAQPEDHWMQVHVIVDGGVVTAIANNRTAITACVMPPNASFDGMSVVARGVGAVRLQAWLLRPAN